MNKKIETLYKSYSKEVMGYILRMADYIYIVINSRLTKTEAAKTEAELTELSAKHSHKLILLKSDGSVQTTDEIDFLERAC